MASSVINNFLQYRNLNFMESRLIDGFISCMIWLLFRKSLSKAVSWSVLFSSRSFRVWVWCWDLGSVWSWQCAGWAARMKLHSLCSCLVWPALKSVVIIVPTVFALFRIVWAVWVFIVSLWILRLFFFNIWKFLSWNFDRDRFESLDCFC